MKKKSVTALLLVCLLCAAMMLTSCMSVEKQLENAMDMTESLDSYAATMVINIAMEGNGIKVSIPMTVDMKVENAQSESPIMSANMSITVSGQTQTAEIYSEGDWLYIKSGDQGIKMSASAAGSDYDYADEMDDIMTALPDELITGKEFVNNEDGSKSITVEIPSNQFSEIFGDLLESIKDTLGATDVSGVRVSDAKAVITLDRGYVTEYDVDFTLDMTVSGVATTSKISATVTVNDPGSTVKVTPPEGYLYFEEVAA